ncbi:MAG: hypothetical protein N4A33_00235 [Bacteriovoracaceae bacterium]|jgi:hypothetical protein|nr:hypothetical protein [Bacteriovoracaceae bacterium]
MTIGQIWENSNRKMNLKVRYKGWDHKTKFFKIQGLSLDGITLFGELDNGEMVTYRMTSDHWEVYQIGAGDYPKAI